MKLFLIAAVVAAVLPVAGCVAEPVFSLPLSHPAHADATTPPLRSQVTALDAPAGQVQPAAAEHHDHAPSAHADAEKKPAKPYPLDVCLVSDEKLGDHGKPFVFEHEGREIKLCCKMCLKDFQKEPAVYMTKLDEAAAKKQSPGASGGAEQHLHHKH